LTDITVKDVTEFYKKRIGRNQIVNQPILEINYDDIGLSENMFTDIREIEL
jgi:hypothetical protein